MTDKLRDAAQQLPPFDDIRVQAVYKILTDDEMPEDKSEHWEGYQARRIVAALAQQDALRAALAGPQQAAEPFTPDWTNYRQGLADGWAEGYEQGVKDERTSEDNIGIAGFGAKVDPARQNPYGKPQPAQQDAQAVPQPIGYARPFDLEALQNPVNPTVLLVVARDAFGFCAAPIYAAPTPPAQRVMLTPEEITEVIVDCYGYSADIEFHECLARAAIEAYERKNGTK